MSVMVSEYVQARKRLLKEAKATPGAPRINGGLKPSAISTEPEVFQPRTSVRRGWGYASENHIGELTRAISSAGGFRELEPLVVWWSGKRWYVVDGHHRLEAIKSFLKGLPEGADGRAAKVPCRAFKGTLREAIVQSTKGNSRDKLSMTRDEKMDAAWRLVCEDIVAREIVDAVGVSKRQVTNMRGVLRAVKEERPDEAPEDLTWKRAVAVKRGVVCEPWDDDKFDREVEQTLQRLRKCLGPNVIKKPDVLAEALTRYHPGLPMRLMKYIEWAFEVVEVAEELKSDPDWRDEFLDAY